MNVAFQQVIVVIVLQGTKQELKIKPLSNAFRENTIAHVYLRRFFSEPTQFWIF